jgi:hypothetical protein
MKQIYTHPKRYTVTNVTEVGFFVLSGKMLVKISFFTPF